MYQWLAKEKRPRLKEIELQMSLDEQFDPDHDYEGELIETIAGFQHDPLGFVEYAFPWGEEGTELETKKILTWQRELLIEVRDGIKSIGEAIEEANRRDDVAEIVPYRDATSSGHGIGKAECLDTLIETPQGLIRFGDIQIGDYVFGADGLPVEVTGIPYRGMQDRYRVTFDDGSFAIVSGKHEWNVRGRQERRNKTSTWRTLETEEILNHGVKRPNGVSMARQWEIPKQGAVLYPPCTVPVDAYTYGIWLGDGDKASGRITNQDDIWQHMPYKTKGSGITRTPYGLKVDMCNHGLFGCTTYNARIDRRYMRSSDRISVMQGLMDADGWVEASGGAAFCSASKGLCEDIVWIARSLGLKARNPKYKSNDHAGAWTAHITWDGVTEIFRIGRKQERLVAAEHRYTVRWINSIERDGQCEMMCISVASADGLYLTNDFIVTHNSAIVSWLVLWAISTFENTRGVVTAGTDKQLKTKTVPELAKWYRLLICRHWFIQTSTAIFSAIPEYRATWRIDYIPWNETNPEAFAGLHNEGKRVFVAMDEASKIPAIIFETIAGAMTDANTEILWFLFGNPTRTGTPFHEAFGRHRKRWNNRKIDSRTVEITNKTELAQDVETYGEDSDRIRVRIRGEFPRAGSTQFIGSEMAQEARVREVEVIPTEPFVVMVDVARFGDDESVIGGRRGRDARSVPWESYQGIDTMELASHAARYARDNNAAAIFVDGTGVGGGVVDRLRQLELPEGCVVYDVQFGSKANGAYTIEDKNVKLANHVAEMWYQMRVWLAVGAIPDLDILEDDLTGREYGYNGKDEIVMERKEHMKKRGIASPDWGDCLALSFHLPIGRMNTVKKKSKPSRRNNPMSKVNRRR